MSGFEPFGKVLKLEAGAKTEVADFQFNDIKSGGKLVFQTPSLKKPASSEEAAAQQKGRRFEYDPVLKDLLVMDDRTEKQIQAEVQTRLESVRQVVEEQARESGHRQGYEAGKAEALEAYRAEAMGKLAELDKFITEFENLKDTIAQAQSRFLVESVCRIAETVVLRELQTDREFLVRTIHEVLERVGAKEQVKIFVRPEALEQAYAVVPDLEKKYQNLRSISIEPAESLGPHDCVVETDWNRVDATLKSQMESFHELLVGATS